MSPSLSPVALGPASPRPAALLHKLQDVALAIAGREVDNFRFQLGDALLKLAESSDKPAEEANAFRAYNRLRNEGQAYVKACDAAFSRISGAALRALEKNQTVRPLAPADDFDAIQDRALLDDLADALEQHLAEPLQMLDARLASLLGRELDPDANPWRPQIFLQALNEAWARIAPDEPAWQRLMLGLLGPQLFPRLEAVYAALGAGLDEQGLASAKPSGKPRRKAAEPAATSAFAPTISPALRSRGERYYQVRDWLLAGSKKDAASEASEAEHLNLPDLFAPPDSEGQLQANTISVTAGPRLTSHLTRLQQQLEESQAWRGATDGQVLRQIRVGLPEGVLRPVDENTIELLARVFDHLMGLEEIAAPARQLLARLQVPTLKAALMDRKFFIDAAHPAHRLLDQLVSCSLSCDDPRGEHDPLFALMSRLVERVGREFKHDLRLLAELSAELSAFLAQEEREAEVTLATQVAAAIRAERLHMARQSAREDINERLESGAVPYFLESFLQVQWLRILSLAHSVREKKPDVLARAQKALDDLIWSLQPKSGPDERRELLARLPGILAEVNTWLNASKWEGPERVRFFASLAERHAALVRLQGEGNVRVEAAVAQARRASERSMFGARRKTPGLRPTLLSPVATLCHGDWLHMQAGEQSRRLKLAWISPGRSQFILTDRRGGNTMLCSEAELDLALQEGRARPLAAEGAVDRALDAVLKPA